MAMASQADVNTAMGTVMTQVNLIKSQVEQTQAQVSNVQRDFSSGGQQLVDEMERKKAELATLNDLLRADFQTYITGATSDLKVLMASLQEHRTVLMEQPAIKQDVADLKQRIEAVRGEIISGTQEKMTRQDGVLNTHITKTHTDLHENLEKKFKEIVTHVEALEKKMGEVKAGTAAASGASGASGDPWQGWSGGAATGPGSGGVATGPDLSNIVSPRDST